MRRVGGPAEGVAIAETAARNMVVVLRFAGKSANAEAAARPVRNGAASRWPETTAETAARLERCCASLVAPTLGETAARPREAVVLRFAGWRRSEMLC